MTSLPETTLGPPNGGRVKALTCTSQGAELVELSVYRRLPEYDDVGIEIMYCGICRCDLRMINNEYGFSTFPMVPGHEITGIVRLVGAHVNKLSVGDRVAVGAFIDSCGRCPACRYMAPQYCKSGPITAYSKKYAKDGDCATYGGFSNFIMVNQDFVHLLPFELPMADSAPLMCAGVTVYSPLKRYGVGPGVKVGIVGIGGLGHLGIQIARALGAIVTAISKTADKKNDAIKLGARHFIDLNDVKQLEEHGETLNVIIDTVCGEHDFEPLVDLLRVNGNLVVLGLAPDKVVVEPSKLVLKRRSIIGSYGGGPREVDELLRLCALHHITARIEIVRKDEINQAFELLRKGDARYRYVLDVRTMKDGFEEWETSQKKKFDDRKVDDRNRDGSDSDSDSDDEEKEIEDGDGKPGPSNATSSQDAAGGNKKKTEGTKAKDDDDDNEPAENKQKGSDKQGPNRNIAPGDKATPVSTNVNRNESGAHQLAKRIVSDIANRVQYRGPVNSVQYQPTDVTQARNSKNPIGDHLRENMNKNRFSPCEQEPTSTSDMRTDHGDENHIDLL